MLLLVTTWSIIAICTKVDNSENRILLQYVNEKNALFNNSFYINFAKCNSGISISTVRKNESFNRDCS